MSCEVVKIGEVVDLKAIKEFFGFHDPDWINGVHLSFSPTLEIVAFAHGNLLTILSSKWSNESGQNVFTISSKKVLDPNELITSLHVIPISMLNHSSSVDWTLIMLGLDQGLVRFFLESGKEIFSYCFHNEPVQNIKSQSGKRINEEIHISYSSCICIVQASSILPVLISLRQQSKRVNNEPQQAGSAGVNNIPFRKWGFNEKNMTVVDNWVVGAQKICSFDHLLLASMDSFSAKFRNTPPQHSLVISCGSKPYVAFNYAKEGFVQPVLKDVAKAVATKIITWFSSSSSQTPTPNDPAQPMPPSEPMVCRFGLCDTPRNACAIWLAPPCESSQFAVVADNLGRLVLLDCEKGIALRMWKGYRDAQCGFIKTNEKLSKNVDKKERRSALFLVIFAPRRACIEIWPLQNGHKVATFHASKTGLLVYMPHNIMGASISTHNQKLKYANNSCIFFDPTEQVIKEITVPFHCALSDTNSKTAKDLHILKRLKTLLKSRDDNTDYRPTVGEIEDEDEKQFQQEISVICENLQTDDIKLYCLEMLARNKKTNPKIFENVLRALERCETIAEETTEKSKTLSVQVANYLRLVQFYNYLMMDDSEGEIEREPLPLADNELVTIKKMIDLLNVDVKSTVATSSGLKVKFEEKEVTANNFMDFLSVFNVTNAEEIPLKCDCKAETLGAVGEIIFKKFLDGKMPLDGFVKSASSVVIPCEELLKIFLDYWLKKPFQKLNSDAIVEELTHFQAILIQICVVAGEKVRYDNSSICLWWQRIRESFLSDYCPLRGLLAAIVCRHVGMKYQEDTTDENWEQVSQEACQWSLLIGKLDEIAVLNTIIAHPKGSSGPEKALLPKLKYDHVNISLERVLQGGKGIISELVAKWIVACDFKPESVLKIESTDVDADEEVTSDATTESLTTLQEYFPFSLQPEILLCHVTWNYLSYWSKHLSRIDALEAGLTCLMAIPKSSLHLKHGLSVMIWNAHLKFPLEALKRLIDKTGRLPKEKLCLQDIGFSDALVPQFLDACSRFLQEFVAYLGYDPMPALQYEDLLQDGPVPLAQLALETPRANSILIGLHNELTEILYAIAFFNIKYKHPIRTLFDGMACQSFFSEINRSLAYTLPQADLILRKKRSDFLCLVITHTMDLIREECDGQVYYDEHMTWMERCEKITDMWGLDFEELKRHQVVELYRCNYDGFAEQLIEKIIDTQSMGKLLLDITGRRLKLYCHISSTRYSTIAAVGPMLTEYLDTLPKLENDEDRDSINLDNLIKLCGLAFHSLSQKTSKELRLAGLLMNACITLKELGI